MGIAKKTDGRYVVGLGVDNADEYKGSASYRDIYIQLTADGATEESVEYLTYLKDYAVYANAQGEPIMPPSINVWISNNGKTTAVEADDLSLEDGVFTICGIKYEDGEWDYSNAGQGHGGGGGGGLPPYTSADKGKFLGLGDGSSTTEVIVPEQTVTVSGQPVPLEGVAASVSDFSVGDTAEMSINGRSGTAVFGEFNNSPAFILGDNDFLVIYLNNAWVFYSSAGTYTVSLTKTVPSVEPKWEAVGWVPNVDVEQTADGMTLLTPFADLQKYADKYGSINLRAIVNGTVINAISASLMATQDKSTIYADSIKGMGIYTNPDSIRIQYMRIAFTSSKVQILGQATATIDATVMS